MKIIGGRSLSRRISIISDRFVADAQCDRSGKVTTTVKALPGFLVPLLQKNYLIPRTLRMLAFIFWTMSPRGRFFAALYIAFLFFMQIRAKPAGAIAPQNDLSSWVIIAIGAVIIGGALFLIRRFVASRHGAEHMTIAAYERSGYVNLEAIEDESPVHPKCGGRLALPILLVSALSFFLSKKLEMHSLIFFISLFEVVLWIDTIIGFDKIMPFAQVSALLQRFVTTKRPGTIEMLTGQAALCELIDAHRRNGAPREPSHTPTRNHHQRLNLCNTERRRPWQSRS